MLLLLLPIPAEVELLGRDDDIALAGKRLKLTRQELFLGTGREDTRLKHKYKNNTAMPVALELVLLVGWALLPLLGWPPLYY